MTVTHTQCSPGQCQPQEHELRSWCSVKCQAEDHVLRPKSKVSNSKLSVKVNFTHSIVACVLSIIVKQDLQDQQFWS